MRTGLILRTLVLAIAAAVILAGCGGDGGSEPTDAPSTDGTSTQSTTTPSGGTGSGDSGGEASSNAPRDYPLDIPEGDFRDVHVEVGIPQESLGQLLYAAADFDRIVAFYEDWTASQPDEYAKVETTDMISFVNTGGTESVNIERNYEYQDEVYTLVGYGGFVSS